MNTQKVREAICLLNNMIMCGEYHSKQSKKAVEDALDELKNDSNSHIYTLIAYKPDSELYSCGHSIEKYPSEFVLECELNSERLIKELSKIILINSEISPPSQESRFNIKILKNGTIVFDYVYDSDSFQSEEEIKPILSAAKLAAIELNEAKKKYQILATIEEEEERLKKANSLAELEEYNRLKNKYGNN